VQATGFVEHLKLPHYVDFQAEIAMLRQMRGEMDTAGMADTVGQSLAEAAE
jgi:alpha-D-ribose 1-methylphosphonate 5-triphosphate synthase subunit PhnI